MMVERPERFVDDYAKAGADAYTVHVEATPHLHYWLERIREAGMAPRRHAQPGHAGRAARDRRGPGRQPALHERQPGLGRPVVHPVVARAADGAARAGRPGAGVEIDGGVGAATIAECARAGANRFTAGSAIFSAPDPAAAYHDLVERVRAAGATAWS